MRKNTNIGAATALEFVRNWTPASITVAWQVAIVVLLLALGACIGCGPRSDRLEVTGEVTLNGTPLDGGSIRFTSLGSERTVASGAMVQKGQYRVPQEHGLSPGKYHVEINAPDPNAPPVIVRATPGGPGIPVAPERIPPEYNRESKQTVEVTADGENHFVFTVSGQPSG